MSDDLTQRVRGVVLYDDRVLLVVHHFKKHLQWVGTWGLPGGAIHSDDTSHADTLQRELYEELALTVTIGRKLGGWQLQHPANGILCTHHVYIAYAASAAFMLNSSEILRASWFTYDDTRTLNTTLGIEHDAIQKAFADD